MSTTIFLVRHGEVEGNSGEKRTFAGRRDLELNAKGVLQAQAIAQRLSNEKLDAVYASTLQRAWRTAEGIAEPHGLQVTRDDALREVNYGDWEGIGDQEIFENYLELWQQRVNDPWSIAPPNGESYAMLWARLEPFWNRVLERHEGQTVALVAHNGPIRVLLCRLLEAPMRNARSLHIGNCSLTKVHVTIGKEPRFGKLTGPRVVIEYINNTSHLDKIHREEH